MGQPRAEDSIEYLVDKIWYKGNSDITTTDFPSGLPGYPVATIDLAIAIAQTCNVNEVAIIEDDYASSVTIPAIDDFCFKGYGTRVTNNAINISYEHNYCIFENLHLAGGDTGDYNTYIKCIIENSGGEGVFYGTHNIYINCHFSGEIHPAGGASRFINCTFGAALKFYCGTAAGQIEVIGGSGELKIMTNAGDNANSVYIYGFNGRISVDSSDTGGDITIAGGKVFFSGTANGTTITKYAVDPTKAYLTGSSNSDGDPQQDEFTGNFNGRTATIDKLTLNPSSAVLDALVINQKTKSGVEDIIQLMYARLAGKNQLANTGASDSHLEVKLYNYAETSVVKTLNIIKPAGTNNTEALDTKAMAGQAES